LPAAGPHAAKGEREKFGQISFEKTDIFARVFGGPGARFHQIGAKIDGIRLAIWQGAYPCINAPELEFAHNGIGPDFSR
jgi:hypothetical protein